MNASRSVCPAAVLRVGCGRPDGEVECVPPGDGVRPRRALGDLKDDLLPVRRVGRIAHRPARGDGGAKVVAEAGVERNRRCVGEDDDFGRQRPLFRGRGGRGRGGEGGFGEYVSARDSNRGQTEDLPPVHRLRWIPSDGRLQMRLCLPIHRAPVVPRVRYGPRADTTWRSPARRREEAGGSPSAEAVDECGQQPQTGRCVVDESEQVGLTCPGTEGRLG